LVESLTFFRAKICIRRPCNLGVIIGYKM